MAKWQQELAWRRAILAGTTALAMAGFVAAPASAADVDELRAEMERLQHRIEQLETDQAETDAQVAENAAQAQWYAEPAARAKASVITPVTTQQNYVTGGDFPGSFKLPGSNTSMAIYGFIKADLIHNFGPRQPVPNLLLTAAIPTDSAAGSGRDGETSFQVNPTQINLETRTPSKMGEVKTHIQFDLLGAGGPGGGQNSANESTLGVRLAYGTIGPLTIGQDWTAFMDLSSYPETMDFEGPNAEIFSRTPQIRWSESVGGGWSYQVGLDLPEINIQGITGVGPALGEASDQVPDLVGHIRVDQAWGHIQLSGMLREIAVDIEIATVGTGFANLPNRDDSEIGWAAALFTQFNDPLGLHPNDVLTGVFSIGRGNKYVIDTGLNAQGIDGAIDTNTGELELTELSSLLAWYRHWWSDTVRSTIVYGLVKVTDQADVSDTFNDGAMFKRSQYAVANLVWSPVPRVNLGVELQYGENKRLGGAGGELFQVQASGFWLF